ncbi:MAG: HD-GYP domain-containing protein [Clostridiales bacterium]|jgi:putative nucleotidyltransferase with HDIG domain|nr:HD-GYP domain-containing protein [Clostridiales bacterium]
MRDKQDMDIKDVDMYDIKNKAGMILSRDVTTTDGVILFPCGARLNGVDTDLLIENGVERIYVKALSNVSNEITCLLEHNLDDDLYRFKKAYDGGREKARRHILDISRGATVSMNELFSITGDIMSELSCKSDVLKYIWLMEHSDEPTFAHSLNVSLLCNLFASWIKLSEEETLYLTVAGILHDVGKLRIPDAILNKTGKLTDKEYEIIKRHTLEGYDILRDVAIPEEIKAAALMHHEKIDGSGYPSGLANGSIVWLARIIAIVDIFDAMTSNRAYRGKICPFSVIKTFQNNVYGELDTEFLLVFLRNIAYTYVGSRVKLSDEREAEVIFINQRDLSNPIVRTTDDDIVDLSAHRDLIVDSLI